MKQIKSVGEIISESKELERFRNAVEGFNVVKEFKEIFPELKKVVRPRKVENGTLFLRVEDSVWRSELNMKKHLIIKKINSFYDKKIIKQIRFL